MTIEEHIPLAPYTTFKIGGPARFFIRVSSVDELQEALAFARLKQLSLFVLGGGSNLLISDVGFSGLVIKNEILGIEYIPDDGKTVVVAAAGENWDHVVEETVIRGLRGLENLSYIPGTVGAAPVQNIGAYGVEAKDTIVWVDAVHIETGKTRRFSHEECEFFYRNSFFKTESGKKFIVTHVAFDLSPTRPLVVSYKDIQAYITDKNLGTLSQKEIRDIVIEIRKRKLPDWTKVGTAGSFFKNPVIMMAEYEKLLVRFPDMPYFKTDQTNFVKVPAAWLLDHVGNFKGVTRGNVGVYENQALVLVNRGNATAYDVDSLAEEMKKTIQEKTGIILEREVESVS